MVVQEKEVERAPAFSGYYAGKIVIVSRVDPPHRVRSLPHAGREGHLPQKSPDPLLGIRIAIAVRTLQRGQVQHFGTGFQGKTGPCTRKIQQKGSCRHNYFIFNKRNYFVIIDNIFVNEIFTPKTHPKGKN